MFDIIPNLLSSIITFLFPIFASYKALRTSDPAQLTPWLMYWVVLSIFSLIESWTWFILSWYFLPSTFLHSISILSLYISPKNPFPVPFHTHPRFRLPFYAYVRLFLLSYLVLPQTQGARLLYQSHIHPFLAHHESDIDSLITHAHDRAKAAGLSSLKRFIEFVKERVLGLPPKSQPARASPEGSYAQTLLSRFNLPSARQGLAAPAGDFYGLLSAALGQVGTGGGSREAQVEEMTRSGTLIPQGMTSASEKMTFLATQRERLRLLLTALDKEASGLETEESIRRDVERRLATPASDDDGLRKSRSEAEFDSIEREDWSGERESGGGGGGGAGGGDEGGGAKSWMPWGLWGTSQPSGKGKEAERGSSSGVDVG